MSVLEVDNNGTQDESYSFRASLKGSALFLGLSALLLVWSILVTVFTDAPDLLDAIAYLLAVGCVLVAAVMLYRLIWRPVLVRVDHSGLYLKTHNALIPGGALEGVRLVEVLGKDGAKPAQLIELVAREPLDAVFQSTAFRNGRTLNQMAGLPDYSVSMEGFEESNALLLAALSRFTVILPTKCRVS